MQLLTALLALSLCLFPTLAAAQSPHIYDVPKAGAPGSQVTTVGNGFDPNATLDLYFDSTDVGLVDTDNHGTFGMALRAPTIRQNGFTIQIPKDAVPGQHWITAVERITQLQAQVPFTVSGDWPQFHYDLSHTGHNPWEVLLSPETVGNMTIRWKFATGGEGNEAAPTVANGVVYVSGGANANFFYALDASTGALLWKHLNDLQLHTGTAVVNGVLFASDGYGIEALNPFTGLRLWQRDLYIGTSPAVVNGVVYVGSADHNVYALNAATGALLWTYTTENGVFSSPAVANGVVYVGSRDYNVYALDANTGAPLWKYATGGTVDSSPAVANGIVYIGSHDDNLYALNANTGALLWKYTTGLWVVSSPAVANGVVYIASFNGSVYALDASTGTLLWTHGIGGAIDYSSPAVANGVVYIGSDGIYALNASSGALLWKYITGVDTNSSPAVVDGLVYICSSDGYCYAFGLPNQEMSEKFGPPERPDPARLTPNWSLQPGHVVTNKSVKPQ